MKQAARRGPAPSILTPYVPQTSSASKQDASTNHRQRTASAYYHLPVTPPQPSDLHQSTTKAPQAFAPWVVRTQQVCKGAATPTVVCGRYSTSLHDPAKQPKATRAGKGQYKCPRCQTGYSRIDSVRQHFPSCIALNGNPDCLSWTDDDSYAAGVVNRSASRAEDGVTAKARKTSV